MKYYKVVQPFSQNFIINTTTTNYGLTLTNKDEYADLLKLVTQFSKECKLPLDFFFSINNGVAMFGEAYLQHWPNSTNGRLEISSITNNPSHLGLFINENVLVSYINELCKADLYVFEEGFYLWEHICESVRRNKYKNLPSREDSLFLFGNIDDCKYYMETHGIFGQVGNVELLEGAVPLKVDMKLWDEIPNNATFNQAASLMDNYWLGKTSEEPVFEYLFQGTCRISMLQ